jgi:hypothetical protein
MIAEQQRAANRSLGTPAAFHFHDVPLKHHVCAVNTDGVPAIRAASLPENSGLRRIGVDRSGFTSRTN